MKKRLLNVVVLVPSLAAAFFLGVRCGDGAKNQVDDGRTIAKPCLNPVCENGMHNVRALASSEPNQVRYAIEWDQEKERFLVNGQQIKWERWQHTTCWNGSTFKRYAREEPDPEEPKVFVSSMDWGVAKPEPAFPQYASNQPQESFDNNRTINSFNSPLDRVLPRQTWKYR